jgi:LPXTG-site transpeptidase (sortase) family protein
VTVWIRYRTGGRGLVLAAAAALAVAGCAGESTRAPRTAPAATPTATTEAPPTPSSRHSSAVPQRIQAADPVRLRMPSIAVDTALIPLALADDGELLIPDRFDVAGWNRSGPEPGEVGASVIAGHVDSRSGPAVFYRLRELRAGDQVHVDRADDTTAVFTVTQLARYAKTNVPSDQVYGPVQDHQLRLITCGGEFDRARRSYRDNVIVYARLTA